MKQYNNKSLTVFIAIIWSNTLGKKMLKTLKYNYIVLLIIFFHCYPSIAKAEEVKYDRKEGRLSINVVNSSLVKVLEEISIKTGVTIKMESEIDRHITVEFNNFPLEDGLKEIIRPNSYAIIFEEHTVEGGKKYSIKTLQVFEKGTSGISNIEIVKDNSSSNNTEISNTSTPSAEKIKIDDLRVSP